jgi:hypothetical protein
MYDYESTPQGDGRNWEAAPQGKGYRARKDDPGLKKQKTGEEEKPSGEPKDISGDPDKTISSAPGVASKQSILSKDPKDFKDHSVSDHYKIMNEVGHDKKLWNMHQKMSQEKSKGLTADEHQKISDEMAEAHAEHGHEAYHAAAFIHASEANLIKQKADKTKEDISAKTGQKDLEAQAGTADLQEEAKKEKLTVEGEGEKPSAEGGGEEKKKPMSAKEAKAAQKKHKDERKKIDDSYKKDTDKFKEKFRQEHLKKKSDLDRHMAKQPVPPKAKVPKPKASNYKDGKVPASEKAKYDKFVAEKAKFDKESQEWRSKKAELSNAAKGAKADHGDIESHVDYPEHPGYGDYEDENMPQIPTAAEEKAAAEKEGAAAAEPKAPSSEMETAQLDHDNKETQSRIDNLQSHMDSGALDEPTKKIYQNLIDGLHKVRDKTTMYSKEEKGLHKQVDSIAKDHAKKHASEAGTAPGKEGGGGKPAAAGGKGPADKGPNVMGAFRSGRRLGQKLGEAAADEKGGGGSIGEAAFNYAGAGAAMLGHKLLSKQSAKPPKAEREPSGKKASQTGE